MRGNNSTANELALILGAGQRSGNPRFPGGFGRSEGIDVVLASFSYFHRMSTFQFDIRIEFQLRANRVADFPRYHRSINANPPEVPKLPQKNFIICRAERF